MRAFEIIMIYYLRQIKCRWCHWGREDFWIKSGTGAKPKPNPNPKWNQKTNPNPTLNTNTNPKPKLNLNQNTQPRKKAWARYPTWFRFFQILDCEQSHFSLHWSCSEHGSVGCAEKGARVPLPLVFLLTLFSAQRPKLLHLIHNQWREKWRLLAIYRNSLTVIYDNKTWLLHL